MFVDTLTPFYRTWCVFKLRPGMWWQWSRRVCVVLGVTAAHMCQVIADGSTKWLGTPSRKPYPWTVYTPSKARWPDGYCHNNKESTTSSSRVATRSSGWFCFFFRFGHGHSVLTFLGQDIRFYSCQGYVALENIVKASKSSGLGVSGLKPYLTSKWTAKLVIKLESCHRLFLTIPPSSCPSRSGIVVNGVI